MGHKTCSRGLQEHSWSCTGANTALPTGESSACKQPSCTHAPEGKLLEKLMIRGRKPHTAECGRIATADFSNSCLQPQAELLAPSSQGPRWGRTFGRAQLPLPKELLQGESCKATQKSSELHCTVLLKEEERKK